MFDSTMGYLRRDATFVNKASFATSTLLGGTIAGYMIIQLKMIAQGKEPIDITDLDEEQLKNLWIESMIKGSGFGLFVDVFAEAALKDGYGGNLIDTFTPPVVQEGGKLINTFFNPITKDDYSIGEYANDLSQWGLDQLPGQNLAQFHLLTERYISNQLSNILDPEWNSKVRKMKRKLDRQYETDYFWEPGELTPN